MKTFVSLVPVNILIKPVSLLSKEKLLSLRKMSQGTNVFIIFQIV